MADLTRLSKFLAVLLRHEADKFGLNLDNEGFTKVDAVWQQINQRFPGRYSYTDLLNVVAGDAYGKKRYEIKNGHIRALFGHSKVTLITYQPAEPPEHLYHGTTRHAIASIRATGLQAGSRQYVHMGTNIERATRVAARYTKHPLILIIKAQEAARAGIIFYNPEVEHYLAQAIPPQFINYPQGI